MKKFNIIACIIAGVTIIFDILFMIVLASLTEAAQGFSELSGDPELADIGNMFNLALAAGWVFAILVAVACAITIKFALQGAKKEKK
jgi:hypothetical protein